MCCDDCVSVANNTVGTLSLCCHRVTVHKWCKLSFGRFYIWMKLKKINTMKQRPIPVRNFYLILIHVLSLLIFRVFPCTGTMIWNLLLSSMVRLKLRLTLLRISYRQVISLWFSLKIFILLIVLSAINWSMKILFLKRNFSVLRQMI